VKLKIKQAKDSNMLKSNNTVFLWLTNDNEFLRIEANTLMYSDGRVSQKRCFDWGWWTHPTEKSCRKHLLHGV